MLKKNPGSSGYLNPCNRERLEDTKRLMFVSGNEFTQWMQQNGIMKNPIDVTRNYMKMWFENTEYKTRTEYENMRAKKLGFNNSSDMVREWRHATGRSGILIYTNKDCPAWFGEFTESLMIHKYPGAKRMPYGTKGFDYLWNGIKIDNKGGCIIYNRDRARLDFYIGWNNVADKFIISGWDNRESLSPLFALEFDKNDLARYGIGEGYVLKKFWQRDHFSLSYPEGLKQFEDYKIDIEWLKELL